MSNSETNISLQKCLSRHPENLFPPAACRYVCDYVYRALGELKESRHITGFEVLETFRKCCISDFGPWAAVVLDHWHITSCIDVGKIVFLLVEAGILAARKEDKLEDFDFPGSVLAAPCPVLAPPSGEIRWEGATID